VLTSALSGAAPTIGLLVAARLLQGVAGGMLLPQNSGLIQELFGDAERAGHSAALAPWSGSPPRPAR
jgi:MFS family permease